MALTVSANVFKSLWKSSLPSQFPSFSRPFPIASNNAFPFRPLTKRSMLLVRLSESLIIGPLSLLSAVKNELVIRDELDRKFADTS